jgi:hypothetical protein
MSKRLLWALLLIAATVFVLVTNHGAITLNLAGFDVRTSMSVAFLAFSAVGVAIGMLLK